MYHKTVIHIVCYCLLSSPVWAEESEPPAPPKRTELASTQVAIPLIEVSTRSVIEARINGKGPYRFILDTGCEGSVLFADLTGELKLPVTGKAQMGDPSDPEAIEVDRVHIDQMQIGGVTLYDFDADSWDAPVGMILSLGNAKGILGIGLFADGLVTLDPSLKKIIFERGQLPAVDNKRVLSWVDADNTLPAISLQISDFKINAHIDTGSPASFTFGEDQIKRFKFSSDPVVVGHGRTVNSEFTIMQAKVDGDIRIGEYVFNNPEIQFMSMLNGKNVCNIGSSILSQFAITYDHKNKRIRWVQTAEQLSSVIKRSRHH